MKIYFEESIDRAGKDGLWLLKPELKEVWSRLDQWLEAAVPKKVLQLRQTNKRAAELDPEILEYEIYEDAADQLVGSLTAPYWLTDPDNKRRIREGAFQAHKKLLKASEHLKEAAQAIEDARKTSSIVPCRAMSIIFMIPMPDGAELTSAETGHRLADTVNFLDELASSITDPPDFSDVPGFESQKCSWHDWFREAAENLSNTRRKYDLEIDLREDDWVKLIRAAVGSHVGRETVNYELRRMRDNELRSE